MFKDYFILALSNLKHRRLRSLLTALGVIIGIAAVVGLISLGNGLENAITGQFSSLDADKLIVQSASTSFGPPGSTAVRKLNEKDVKLIESINYVSDVVPRLIRIVKIEYNDEVQFVYSMNVPEKTEEVKIVIDSFNIKLEEGRFLDAKETGNIVIGNDIKNLFGKELRVGSKIKIQNEEFEVIGILEKSSSFQINQIIFISEENLKEILDIENEIDLIVVQISDENQIHEIAEEIEKKLRRDRNQKIGEEDFSVQTPLQSIQAINTVMSIINIIISGIAAISLLIGGIGIANTMYTSVVERKKEIGVMKAIGAKNNHILIIFIVEAGTIGLIGGIIGSIIGLGMALALSSLASIYLGGIDFSIKISWPLIISAVGFSSLVGILSGILPALQASKLNIVEAIRN